MAGKKHQLARLATATGLTRILEKMPRRPSLLILNYHRIGDARATTFDSGVFSSSAAELDCHVRYLKQRFRIVSLKAALGLLDGRQPVREPSVLLTFDDGYLDNYQTAFPILVRHNACATFFLPTAFIGTGAIPWWDAIASLIKRSSRPFIQLETPVRRTFSLSPVNRERSIVQILNIFKSDVVRDSDLFFAELAAACDVSLPPDSDHAPRSFLNWDEAREMQAAGMSFGSHTHTHRILSKLSLDEQRQELRISREMMERELGRTIETFAYPVGDLGSYNADTLHALTETRYSHAFSFVQGVNRLPAEDRFQIMRIGIFSGSLSLLRLRSTLQTLAAQSQPAQTPALSHLSQRIELL